VSKFPPVRRDIAVVVEQTIEAQALLDELARARREEACRYVQDITLFDEFKPKIGVKSIASGGLGTHEKSLAFRITLQDTGGTLTDETVDRAIKMLVDRLARVYGARLRG
jgi:phenylalanyl-tRNA synthetase beta chain